ncbi:unnamed protein product [Calypogeia fissa]
MPRGSNQEHVEVMREGGGRTEEQMWQDSSKKAREKLDSPVSTHTTAMLCVHNLWRELWTGRVKSSGWRDGRVPERARRSAQRRSKRRQGRARWIECVGGEKQGSLADFRMLGAQDAGQCREGRGSNDPWMDEDLSAG